MEVMEICDRITYYRIRRGLSKKELAELCGISPSMIAKYESGKAKPSMDTVAALAQTLGVTMNRLVHGFDEEETSTEI